MNDRPAHAARAAAWAAVRWSPLMAAIALVAWGLTPPAPDSDSERAALRDAQALIADIATAPRPRGSPAHARVRELLLSRLRAIGLDADAVPGSITYGSAGRGPKYEVVNLVGRLRADTSRPGEKPLLLLAHYDSARFAPGAGDDASGVAAVLHAANALAKTSGRSRDVIVALTDGEEEGLLGATAWFAGPMRGDDLAAVLNFEARGNSGPVVMFETDGDESQLLAALAGAVPVSTSSFASTLYRVLPNSTDFTVTRHVGVPGMNFAFIGGWIHYHRPTDSPENLSPRTLNQQLRVAEGLAVMLATRPSLDLRQRRDRVFFDLLGRVVVYYPTALALPLALLGTAWLLWLAARFGPIRWVAGLSFLTPLLSAGAVWGLLALVPGATLARHETLGVLALMTVPVLIAAVTSHFVPHPRSWAIGGLMVVALLAVLSAWLLPGASYLLLAPLLFGTAALATPRRLGPAWAAAAVLVTVPTLWLVHLATMPAVVPPGVPLVPVAALLTSILTLAHLQLFTRPVQPPQEPGG